MVSGGFLRCRPATDRVPLVCRPRATRRPRPPADGPLGSSPIKGRAGDGGYLRCEAVCRQANSREETDNARRGSHFADTQLFRSSSPLAEKVAPSRTVTDRGCASSRALGSVQGLSMNELPPDRAICQHVRTTEARRRSGKRGRGSPDGAASVRGTDSPVSASEAAPAADPARGRAAGAMSLFAAGSSLR